MCSCVHINWSPVPPPTFKTGSTPLLEGVALGEVRRLALNNIVVIDQEHRWSQNRSLWHSWDNRVRTFSVYYRDVFACAHCLYRSSASRLLGTWVTFSFNLCFLSRAPFAATFVICFIGKLNCAYFLLVFLALDRVLCSECHSTSSPVQRSKICVKNCVLI